MKIAVCSQCSHFEGNEQAREVLALPAMDGKALLGAAICGGIAGSLATMLLMKTPAAPAATAAAPAATAAVPAANINVPKQQLDPVEYEAASGSASSTDRDSRLLRRVET
eukprot:2495925-Rhodomonas_salina.1